MLKFLTQKSKTKRTSRVRNAYAMEFRAAFDLSIMLRVRHVLKTIKIYSSLRSCRSLVQNLLTAILNSNWKTRPELGLNDDHNFCGIKTYILAC